MDVGFVVATACIIVWATVVFGTVVTCVVETWRVVSSVTEATEADPSVAREVEAQQHPEAMDRRRTTKTTPIIRTLERFILDDQR